MVDRLSFFLVLVFLASAATLAWSQTRYLSRYRQVHGFDPYQTARIARAPWLFFVLLRRLSRDMYAAYSIVQPEPELEQLRRRVHRWQRLAIGTWALLMLLAVLRLAGIA